MKWQVHPARENITKTIISLFFVVTFIVLIAIFYNLYWAFLGLIILFASLYSYYFPTTYEITDEEVIIKNIFTTQKRKLNEFKKFYVGKNGVLLSPFKHKTFLNNFRGVFLLLPAQRTEIINYIKTKFVEDDG
ncbi:MAG: hypothetical protein N3A65_03735 [candidate division WOR-3 bacterium]|nr:hypothetical protein [candidate division WOR-3 bacterium]